MEIVIITKIIKRQIDKVQENMQQSIDCYHHMHWHVSNNCNAAEVFTIMDITILIDHTETKNRMHSH